jgi:amino acid transporter
LNQSPIWPGDHARRCQDSDPFAISSSSAGVARKRLKKQPPVMCFMMLVAGNRRVIGLAFAVAGYSSFWLLAAMSVLLALVGINYMAICRHYPDGGGGVYASVYRGSKIIAITGALLLIADYIVTAAIGALSAFQFLAKNVILSPRSDQRH